MPSAARPDSARTENAAAPDSAELTKLLRDFLAGASRNDVAMHDRFWADDLIYTSSNGRRIGKADIMKDVREEGPPKPGDDETVFTAEDIRIQQYESTAILAFRLVGTTPQERQDRSHKLSQHRHTPQAQRKVAGGQLAGDEDAGNDGGAP
jgi:hypothetical protein